MGPLRGAGMVSLCLLLSLPAVAPSGAAQEPEAVLDGTIVPVRAGSSVVWPNSAGKGGYLVLKPDGAPMMVEPGNVSQAGVRGVHGLALWAAEGPGDVTLRVWNNSGVAAVAMRPFYLGGFQRSSGDFNSTTALAVPPATCQLHWMRAPATTTSDHAFWLRASGDGLRFQGRGDDLRPGESNDGHYNLTIPVQQVERWFLHVCNPGTTPHDGVLRTTGEPPHPGAVVTGPPAATPAPGALALLGIGLAAGLRLRPR